MVKSKLTHKWWPCTQQMHLPASMEREHLVSCLFISLPLSKEFKEKNKELMLRVLHSELKKWQTSNNHEFSVDIWLGDCFWALVLKQIVCCQELWLEMEKGAEIWHCTGAESTYLEFSHKAGRKFSSNRKRAPFCQLECVELIALCTSYSNKKLSQDIQGHFNF